MAEKTWEIFPSDQAILRRLAQRKVEMAYDPVNQERRELWFALDAGHAWRPMVLAESWVAFEGLPESKPMCQAEWARGLEQALRFEIFRFERVQDDYVVEPCVDYNWRVNTGDFGVVSVQEYASRVSGNISSRRWEPPITDLHADFHKLHPRSFSVDRETTRAWKALLEEVFDDILVVRLRGGYWWTTGMTQTLIDLIGLEPMMTALCEDPGGIHQLMAFLQADCLAFAEWLERENLLSLNNENDYIGSGSIGYSRALPQPDWKPGDPVRLKDLWVLSESQETVGVGPDQYEEFVFQYQKPIIERFGGCYYGCCEPVHTRWRYLKTLPNVKRLSISPWCDQAFMAEAMGRDRVFSRKPNPAFVSTPYFDEEIIRNDLRTTLTLARNCNVELILKDVHTLCGQPQRMERWVEIAREVIDECAR